MATDHAEGSSEAPASETGSGVASAATTVHEAEGTATKPWSISGTFEQSLGSGTFTAPGDAHARTVAYSWAFVLRGSYRLTDMLTASLRLDLDKQLTVTAVDAGSKAREFYFRDIRLGVGAEEIYRDEQYTGIAFGASSQLRLPTDTWSRAAGRVLRWDNSATLSRTFEDVGPGSLRLSFMETLRKDFGPRARDRNDASYLDTCRSIAIDSAGDCVSNIASANWGLVHTLSAEYNFFEKWTVSLQLLLINTFYYGLSGSETPERLAATGDAPVTDATIGRSRYAIDAADQRDQTWGILEVGYQATENIGLALGLSSLQAPFIQSGGNSKALTFPFWDFATPSNNQSSVYFDATFTY
ncbi:MAG: hypothetical protein IPK13_11405 [Deltaproteobacteria bacterium]|nr:hypothetical protein [Deltaproteobacteria bacterium]